MRATSLALASILTLSFTLQACGSGVVGKPDTEETKNPANKNNNPTGSTTTTPTEPDPNAPYIPKPYIPTAGIDGPTHVDFQLPRGAPSSLFTMPWPTDLLRKPDGKLDLKGFPQRDRLLVSTYVEQAEKEVDGYSLGLTAYFHFSGGAPGLFNIPNQLADTMSIESPVFIMDVDPYSPEKGTFFPLEVRYYDQDGLYVKEGTLAVKAHPGFVGRPGTLYAAVVRRDFKNDDGALLGTTADFEFTKWTDARASVDEEAARQLHYDAFNQLEQLGLARDQIAAMTVFRTQNPHNVTLGLVDTIKSMSGTNVPRIISAIWDGTTTTNAYILSGVYCTPNFQQDIDKAPFTENGGGTFNVAQNGKAQVVPIPTSSPYYSEECKTMIRARFVLSVPKTAMPATGWPLMLSAHGTGGDAKSFVGSSDFSGWAAAQGIAVVSTDQPLHGSGATARPGADKPITLSLGGFPIPMPAGTNITAAEMFYNPINPAAGRDNARQATADGITLLALMAKTDFATLTANSAPVLAVKAGRENPRFDATRMMLSGHSQGSQTVAPQAAVDPTVKGVLLSGCGGDIRYGVLRRTNPFELKPLLGTLVGAIGTEFDEFHPLMLLVQTLADGVDPQSYARFYREPLAGMHPQNVLHYIGSSDSYNPVESGEALAVALRATQLKPTVKVVVGQSILGIPPVDGPIEGNFADRQATIGFIEMNSTKGEDGHFVIYYEPGADKLASEFFGSIKTSGPAIIPALAP